MNRDNVNDLLMGAAVIALGYALFRHFKPGTTAPGGAQAAPGRATFPGFAYGEPSPFTSLTDLLTGTVHDIGSFEGHNYLADMEAAPPKYGNGPRLPGGYW